MNRSFGAGRYVVDRVLGEGGQKVVYLVHDEALDRDCALSVVKSELLEPEDLERLHREAQAMARLGAHSNIVTVHDIGDEDGTPYLVCEYVPAGELRRYLRDAGEPLPLERALTIAADIARALAVAHGRGVIHRDVKPANIWLCEDGSAKLGDFGLAFSIDRTRMTIAGTVVGTATYMAPEQARGEPADARTDLYALGVMLYEMICGRPPFSGDDPLIVISQHAAVAPAAPALHVAGLPPALNDLILRLLAKPPDLRPESAAVVGEELRAITESLRTPELPVEPEPQELENSPAAPGLHWADKGTIAMLQQVARTSATQRILVLGAYRDVELDHTHPLADALADLRRQKGFERIALRGLDGAEVAELLDAIAEQDVPAPLAEAIARETGGNPFFALAGPRARCGQETGCSSRMRRSSVATSCADEGRSSGTLRR